MKRFALSLVANKIEGSGQTIHHSVVVLCAVSREEAIGKGFQIIHEQCPSKDGWQGHSIIAVKAE